MPRRRKHRRPKHAGSVHRVGNSWRVAIIVRGKRVAATFPTKAEAEEYRSELAQSVASGTEISNDSFSFVVESWLEHIQATKDIRTHDAYSWAVEPFQQVYEVSSSTLRVFHLQSIVDTLTGRKAQMAHDKIRQCLRWAVKMGLMMSDPGRDLERPRHERRPIEVFDREDVRQILDKAQHLRDVAAIRLAFSVGTRGGELFGLKWWDWGGTELAIQRQAAERSGVVTIKPPKRNSVRTISLPDSVVLAIENRNLARLKEGFAGCEWIFPDRNGNPVRRSNFMHRGWAPLLKSAGIRHRGFHHCRHTAASLMLNNGVPITTVSRTLGHKDPATTLSIYASLMTSDLDQHRNRFDEVFSRPEAV